MLSNEAIKLDVYNAVADTAFFRRLVREWSKLCKNTDVYSAVSDADYRAAKTLRERLQLRWRMYPGYSLKCWRKARVSQSAIRVVTTNPFFAPALIARAANQRGATINLLYDLYPDALIQAGKISEGGRAAQHLATLTRYALRKCEATVFLGERLKAYAEHRYGAARYSVVIPVGADGEPFKQRLPSTPSWPLKILYCGQLGRMHDVDTIAGLLSERLIGVEFHFRSSGAGYRNLRQKLGDRPGVVWGHGLPDDEWTRVMLNSAIALVTVAEGAERVVMPSKTYSALVAGQAILAICPRNSDLADLVIGHDCGWVIAPGDIAGLRQLLKWIVTHPEALVQKRQRAYRAGHAQYDMGVLAEKWRCLFEHLHSTANSPVTRPLHCHTV